LDALKDHYRRGGLGDVKCKRFLIAVLEELLQPIRERRKHYEQHIEEVYDILRRGSDEAREAAAATLNDVRRSMRINYFEDSELISRQAEQYRK
jgi:tryptophanyl-tRNA synthetase